MPKSKSINPVSHFVKSLILTSFIFLVWLWLPKTVPAQAQVKKTTDHGKADTCYIEITQKKDKLIAKVNIFNDQKLSGAAIPLKYGDGKAPLKVDSVSFLKTRVEGFAWKHGGFTEKTVLNDSSQAILIGLIANLGGPQPPLDKGNGAVAYIYFTLKTDKPYQITLDTTSLPPNNSLMLVDPEAGVVPLIFRKGTFKANGKQ